MATSSRLSRPRLIGAMLAVSTTLLAACTSLFPGAGSAVPKIYIKDYTLNVGARHTASTSDKAFEDLKIDSIRSLGNIGLTYSPNYVFVAEPVLLLAMAEPFALPTAELVKEMEYDAQGKEVVRDVLRRPLFILQKSTITYTLPGYTIAPVTLIQQIPIKSTSYTLRLPGIAQVNELMATFAKDPASAAAVSGTVTVTCDIQDLNPLAASKTFTAARTFPIAYSYMPFRPETTASFDPSPTPRPSPTPNPASSQAPSEAPSTAPSDSLFASPSAPPASPGGISTGT